jgi:hypothetical protein
MKTQPDAELDIQNTQIILLGTNHGDITGRSRLLYALDKLQPDLITVEASSIHIEKFEKRESEILTKGITTCIDELIREFPEVPINRELAEILYCNHGYEYFTARDYGRGYRAIGINSKVKMTQTQVPYFCVEGDEEFFEFQKAQEKLTGLQTARHYFACLASQSLEEYVLRNYFCDGQLEPIKIDTSPLLAYPDSVDLIQKRDAKVSQNITELVREYKPRRLVHVCGKYHLGHKVQKEVTEYTGLPPYFDSLNTQAYTLGEIVSLRLDDGELMW